MMESITKNKQTKETLYKMIDKAFPETVCKTIQELKEGFFNAAYLVTLENDQETVLKIAPPPDALIMSYEKNIMLSEVDSMRLVKAKTSVPIADVLFYDNSRTICSSEYFFMSKLPGQSLNSLTEAGIQYDKKAIQTSIGKYTAELNNLVGEKFGYYGQPDTQGCNWFAVFENMIRCALEDAHALSIDITVDEKEIKKLLEQDKEIFEEVSVPHFVHWDLWDGNIFVENGHLAGIIDFERCLWGDPLMEVGFRSNQVNDDFLAGYGIKQLTYKQKRRIKWYDVYLLLQMSLEYDYRHYETKDFYVWATGMLRKAIANLQMEQ